MFWKYANLEGFKKTSIKMHLAFFYALAAFTVLTIISLFLYWETVNIIHKADYQFLSDGVESLQTMLKMEPMDLSTLKKEVIETPLQTNNSIYRYFIRITNEKNQIMLQTPGINKVLPHDLQFNLTPHKKVKHVYRRYNKHQIDYLLIQSSVQFANHQYGLIQIALDITYQHDVMSDQKFLLIALLLSLISSLFIGYFIANRGMRSLYSLTDTVQQITASSLYQRIDPATLPKDLQMLGNSFNQMLDRIESSFLRLKQFSSDLAHELRTPIHNLIGETELALSREQTPKNYQQVMISNMEEYTRISHMIENILFLSRAENPTLDIQKSWLNVSEEIQVICEYYQATAEEKNIAVSSKGEGKLNVNLVMFRRMISNLLSNALKYTNEGGWVNFEITSLANSIQIKLSDSGIGIAKQHLPKIFDRFYRVDCARTQQTGGIGLGLPIVKSIVDLHQGQIEISSQVNHGTILLLTFPVS